MNIEELKALKAQADNLIKTFQNDREIMENEKKNRLAENEKNFDDFIGTLTSYVEIIPDSMTCNRTYYIMDFVRAFSRFSGVLINSECSRLTVTIGKTLHFEIKLYRETYFIIVSKTNVEVSPSSQNRNENTHLDLLKRYIVQNKEAFLELIEDALEDCINQTVSAEKNKNDRLYEECVKFSEENT